MNSKITPALSFLLVALFLGYHVLVDNSYRPSADDFAVTDLATHGLPGINFAVEMYLNWEGPFLGMTILGLVCWLANVFSAWLPLLLVKAGLIASSAVLLNAISVRNNLDWSKSTSVSVAVIFSLVLYLISPNQPEIWHWLVGTPYLVPLIFIQLGVAALIQNRILLAVIPFAFVMQSRATYAVLIFGLLFLISAYQIIKKNRIKDWSIFIAATLGFLIIYLAAPGNYTRLTEHGNSVSFMISQFKTGLINQFVSYNAAKLDRVVLGLIAMFGLVGNVEFTKEKLPKTALLIPFSLYLLFVISHKLLFVLITGYCEWTRVLSLHSFLFLTMSVAYGFWAFGLIPKSLYKWSLVTTALAVLALFVRVGIGLPSEILAASQFTEQYDQRMKLITSYTGEGDTLFVQPIDYSGRLYFEDFSEDPDNWINKDFRKAYNLPFKVAVKPRN